MTKVPVKSIVWNATTSPLLAADWTEILAALDYPAAFIEVAQGSTIPIMIAIGAIGEEEEIPYTVMAGGTNGIVAQSIAAGSRISLKPVDTDISDGFIVLNLFTGTP